MDDFVIVTLRLPRKFHRQVKVKLAKDGSSFQGKLTESLEEYLRNPIDAKPEVVIASESMGEK